MKPNGLSVSGSVRNTEDNSTESSDCRESNSNKDSSVQQNTSEHVSCEASGSGGDHDDGKAQENEVRKQFIKQKSMPPEDRCSNSCEASGSKKPLIKQKSMPAGERDSRESNGLDDRPRKKQKLDGSVTVSNGRSTDISQRDASTEGKRDTDVFKRPREKVTGGEDAAEESRFVKKKPYLGVSVSEGKDAKTGTEKGLSKRPSFDGKLIKRAEDKMVETDYKRNCQVTEVSRKPDAVSLYCSCYVHWLR